MAMGINDIEQKVKNFEDKYEQLKGSADNGVLTEIETAIKNIKTSLGEAKQQDSAQAEITIGSLSESVQEIEEYISTL